MIRGLQPGDLQYLADNLRGADRIELLASSGTTDALQALERSVQASTYVEVGTGPDGLPVVIWGAAAHKGVGIIWAVATPAIKTHRMEFLRNCQQVIAKIFDIFAVNSLINFTHGENTLHHRWLKWCGAELLPEVPYGPQGEAFRPFVIRRGKPLV